ncbi:MAG: hypothetical protein KAY46_26210 [Burkholderiaceae bacterium]|nr:hypothetical protein [Burkholderiaceae bacterium]
MDLSDPSPSMLDASVVSRPGAGSSRTSALDLSAPPSADLVPQLISPIVWQLSFPVLIVDASRRLLYGNHAGRALLEAGQALVLRDERLDCVSGGDRARLDRALLSCFGVGGGSGGSGGHGGSDGNGSRGEAGASGVTSFCLSPCGSHAPLTVSVARLDAGGAGDGMAAASLILNRGASLSPVHRTALRDLFELTDSEAAVTEALWEGLTIPEIASARMTSPTTVRTQIRSIFAKTLVSRQQDLIRLLASLPQLAIGGEATPRG